MAMHRTIEIDLVLHKYIEAKRESFDQTPNDVLRKALGINEVPIPVPEKPAANGQAEPRAWEGEGVRLPHGTTVRMQYGRNNQFFEGMISNGKWLIQGMEYDTPSGAASGIATTRDGNHTKLNGWNYWMFKLPDDHRWTPLAVARRKPRRAIF